VGGGGERKKILGTKIEVQEYGRVAGKGGKRGKGVLKLFRRNKTRNGREISKIVM